MNPYGPGGYAPGIQAPQQSYGGGTSGGGSSSGGGFLSGLLGPIGGLASTVLGGLFNIGAQKGAERRSRNWELDMYNRRYADNLKLWHMQNAYNAPLAQMGRLRRAGLNPMLMYGKGGAGGAAAGKAESITTPDTEHPQFRVPQWDGVFSKMSQYFDLKIKQAQVNNLNAQTTDKINRDVAHMVSTYGFDPQNRFPSVMSRWIKQKGSAFNLWSKLNHQFSRGRSLESQADYDRSINKVLGIDGNIQDSKLMRKISNEINQMFYDFKTKKERADYWKWYNQTGKFLDAGAKFVPKVGF